MRPARVLLVIALLSGCSGLSAPQPEGPLTGQRLVDALHDGGLVLYLRHTATDEAPDGVPGDDCSRQRNLTSEGRAQAQAIGVAVRRLDVPIGLVLASPFCRTAETAELAFGSARTSQVLLPLERGDDTGPMRELLSTEPADGSNTILVGHISNIRPAADVTPEEGATVVFRPHGDGRFLVVAEVPAEGWSRFAEVYD